MVALTARRDVDPTFRRERMTCGCNLTVLAVLVVLVLLAWVFN